MSCLSVIVMAAIIAAIFGARDDARCSQPVEREFDCRAVGRLGADGVSGIEHT